MLGTFLLIGLGIIAVLVVLRILGGLFGRSRGAGYPRPPRARHTGSQTSVAMAELPANSAGVEVDRSLSTRVRVMLRDAIQAPSDRPEYQRAIVAWEDGRLVARSTGAQRKSVGTEVEVDNTRT